MDVQNKTHKYVDDYVELADELYKILFPKGIIDFLGKKTENMIIVPDGMLATLGFVNEDKPKLSDIIFAQDTTSTLS